MNEYKELQYKLKNYFNKWILRAGLIPLIIVLLIGLYSSNFDRVEGSFCCKALNSGDCKNTNFNILETEAFYTTEYVKPGECVTKEANAILKYYNTLAFFILLLTFILNHIYFKHKQEKKRDEKKRKAKSWAEYNELHDKEREDYI
jgi:hypothetical protein